MRGFIEPLERLPGIFHDGKSHFMRGGFDSSYNRSLKKLLEWGLVTRTAKKSLGRHGHLYRLTDAGREKAKKDHGGNRCIHCRVRKISMIIDQSWRTLLISCSL
jgi:hypothetical protein